MPGFQWVSRCNLAIGYVEFDTKSFSAGQEVLATFPVYNTSWVSVILTITGTSADVYLIPDTTAGYISQQVLTLAPGEHTCWVMTHGVPPEVSTDYGAHTVTVKIAPHAGGTTTTVGGHAFLRVERRT